VSPNPSIRQGRRLIRDAAGSRTQGGAPFVDWTPYLLGTHTIIDRLYGEMDFFLSNQ
jgi:hypothetical protein